jgi:hypothetical protein
VGTAANNRQMYQLLAQAVWQLTQPITAKAAETAKAEFVSSMSINKNRN